MKEAVKSYFSFHRSQRLGLVILMSLLVLLLLVLVIVHQTAVPDAGQPDWNHAGAKKTSFSATE